jgi:hypothetical protein
MADLRFFADPDADARGPYMVDYVAAAIKPSAIAQQQQQRAPPPMEAANGDGVPQVAPPLIPMTVEQQRFDNKEAAVQYGGARPSQMQANGTNGLIIAGLFIGGMLVYLRTKQ